MSAVAAIFFILYLLATAKLLGIRRVPREAHPINNIAILQSHSIQLIYPTNELFDLSAALVSMKYVWKTAHTVNAPSPIFHSLT